VSSFSEWGKRKYLEDPDYREKKLAYGRAYDRSHRKEITARRRRKLEADPAYREKERARGREYRRKKRCETIYGISLDQYEAMVSHQSGLCAICNRKPDRTLCVDHSHATGQVRALLCSNCNSMLGFAQDDPSRLGCCAGRSPNGSPTC
jgi:hypothetical protein